MNRIAKALGVEAAELVQLPQDTQLSITAHLGADGAHAPTRTEQALTTRPGAHIAPVRVTPSLADYRPGVDIRFIRLQRHRTGSPHPHRLPPRPPCPRSSASLHTLPTANPPLPLPPTSHR